MGAVVPFPRAAYHALLLGMKWMGGQQRTAAPLIRDSSAAKPLVENSACVFSLV